ncbi:hypothetical protein [Fodinicola feengrottensis]|uniref:hypothetical protein n=1 Tax=Fodinicola feengrottensis TaxID=435914 RepID=UPI0024430528|nr:hypothetical protein [Fodinicola feengrottensis]
MTDVSRRALLAGATGTAGALALPAFPVAAAAEPRVLTDAASYAVSKLRTVAPTVTAFPTGTKFEKWAFSQDGDWVGGFWAGALWLAWIYSGEENFQSLAIASATKLAPRQNDTSTHDLGFLFSPSWVTGWRLTGDDKWRAGALQAASSLIQRYNPAGRFIRAWGALGTSGNAGRAIMDTLMNLDLLSFASQQTGDPKYLDIAIAHARTTQHNFVRPTGRLDSACLRF